MIGLLAAISALFYLYTFITPLNDILQFDWDSAPARQSYPINTDQRQINLERKKYIQDTIYSKFHIPIATSINIPRTEFTIPIPVSWHSFECLIFLFFLLYFLLADHLASHLVKWSSILKKLDLLLLTILRNKWISTPAKVFGTTWINRTLFPVTLISFALFSIAVLTLRHHGGYISTRYFEKLFVDTMLAIIPAVILLSTTSRFPQTTFTAGRRKFLAQSSSIIFLAAAAASAKILEKTIQSIYLGNISHPRYRTSPRIMWHKISASQGLYQHIKSRKYYYVNNNGQVRSSCKINEMHLIKANISELHDSDFVRIPKFTSSVFFEEWSLMLLKKGQILDALNCLENGCKYEIFRIRTLNEQHPNIRVFKLYAGLCRKHKLMHHLFSLRREITHDKNLIDLLQPSPQRWLMTRASCFRQRWLFRKQYNKHPLTSI